MTHLEAMHYYEYPEYDSDERYAEIIRITMVGLFYSYLVPLSGILSLLGIVVTSHFYFIVLCKYSKRPKKIDEILPIKLF